MQRYTPEAMFGLSKKWMVHGGATFSDMYSNGLRGESVRLYTKYRFLSNDDVHQHFRMAAFALASYSRNKPRYNELNLGGDQSGIQAGVIATQLIHKLAVSGTASLTEVLHKERWQKETQDGMHGVLLIIRFRLVICCSRFRIPIISKPTSTCILSF
jgi:hypothetical protein